MDNKKEMGRLALREEGNYWVAYYAMPDTMDEAIELARIHMGLVISNPERKELFMLMLSDCLNELVEDATGIKPAHNGFKPAPESERCKNA